MESNAAWSLSLRELSAIELDAQLQPIAVAEALADLPNLVFLDSSRPDPDLGRYSYVTAAPAEVLVATGRCITRIHDGVSEELVGHPLVALRSRLIRHRPLPGLPPFQGGAVGYFGYELRHIFEPSPRLPADSPDLPDLAVGIYDWVIAWDHLLGRCWLITPNEASSEGAAPAVPRNLRARLAAVTGRPLPPLPPAPGLHLASNFTPAGYLAAIQRAKEYIAEGHIYQVNLSQRFRGRWCGDAWALYRRLRAISPAPYGAYLNLAGAQILSASPERFLRVEAGQVDTRPIKGTRPRGDSPQADARLAAELANSTKDRAENLMIVDLLRNDLGKVCRIGSVRVPHLHTIEGYAQVWHLVSTIVGDLDPQYDTLDLLAASLPGGSVTGCPKIRAMEIIAELEQTPRGVYCGAIGYLDGNGTLNTSVVIRTIVIKGKTLSVQVGGAIVADSDPDAEYAETLTKAAGAFQALGAKIDGMPTGGPP